MVPSSTDHPLPVLESDPPTVPFADDDPLIQALTCFHWESNPGGDVDTFISDSFEYPFQPRMCSPDFFESVNRWMETDNQLLASASLARVDSHPALPNYDLLGDIPRTPLTLDLVQSICSPPFSSPFIPAYPSSAALSILWSTNMLQYPQYILDICSPTTAPETNPPGMGMTLASVPFSTETYANTNDFNLDFDFGPSFDYGSGLTSSSPNSSSFICSGEGGGVVSQVRGFRSLSSFCCAAVACASSVRSPASSLSPPSPAASSVFSPSSTGLAPVSVSVPVSEAAGSCFDEIVGSGFDDLDEVCMQFADQAARSSNHHCQLHDDPENKQYSSATKATVDISGSTSSRGYRKFRDLEELQALFPVTRTDAQNQRIAAILQSPYYLNDIMEPMENHRRQLVSSSTETFGNGDGVELYAGGSRNERSIFHQLIERARVGYKWMYKCVVCGRLKKTSGRALGRIRSDLNHRPFVCEGSLMGCKPCSAHDGFARFFSRALLVDHLQGQKEKVECIQWLVPDLPSYYHQPPTISLWLQGNPSLPMADRIFVGTPSSSNPIPLPDSSHKKFRRGGMKRHWRSMHPELTFPAHIYPKYAEDTV